jgi:hypothetical protein
MNEGFRFPKATTINEKLEKTSPETTLFISADFKTIAIALYHVNLQCSHTFRCLFL